MAAAPFAKRPFFDSAFGLKKAKAWLEQAFETAQARQLKLRTLDDPDLQLL